jgi:hypothetical protein
MANYDYSARPRRISDDSPDPRQPPFEVVAKDRPSVGHPTF